MLDVLLMAVTLGICGGIGLPITELLPPRFAGRALIAPVLGLAVLAVLSPVSYRFGVSPLVLLIASGAAAVLGAAWWARRLARRGITAEARSTALAIVAAWLAVLLVMLLPRWAGGEQFSVFQGNMWDCFGYLESALTYARRSYASIVAAGDPELAKNPLMPMAQSQLAERPSIHLLYATFSRVAAGEAYRMYYPFLVALQSQCMLVGVFLLRAVLPGARPGLWIAAAAAFPLGFWGQYVFDLNAWSEIASSPLLFLLAALVLCAMIAPLPRGDDVRLAGVIAVIVAGSVYLYPEGFTVYTVALGGFAIVVSGARMIRARQLALRSLIPLAGIAGLAAVALYPPLVQFLAKQIAWGAARKVDWWTLYQAFFYGRDATPGEPTDFVAGLFGLYFATPAADTGTVLAALQRAAIIATIAGTLGALVAVRARDLPSPSRALLWGWAAITALLLLPAGVLGLQGTYWAAGKVVSYAAPVLVTLLAAPIAFAFDRRALKPLRWAAIAFVVFQLGLGVVRIIAAGAPDGIHYAAPYPSITRPWYKRELGWDMSGLDTALASNQTVMIAPIDPWPEAYLMMYLYTRRIRFGKIMPVNTYFNAGRNVGAMTMATPDFEIFIEPTAWVLHHRDGRPDVRVRTRNR